MSFPSTDNFERSHVTKQYIHMYTHKHTHTHHTHTHTHTHTYTQTHTHTPSTQIKMKVTPFFITTPPILPTTLFLWEEKSNPFFFSYLKNSTPLPFTREGGGGSKLRK